MAETWITPKARKGVASGIAGRGLRVVEPISAGEVIAVKGGHIVSTAEHLQLPDPLPNPRYRSPTIWCSSPVTTTEYEAVMLYINHSCDPNVGIRGNIVFVAMRDVDTGEELTIDYAMIDDNDGAMACTCGSPTAAASSTGGTGGAGDLQVRYRGWFSWYLQRKIDLLHQETPRWSWYVGRRPSQDRPLTTLRFPAFGSDRPCSRRDLHPTGLAASDVSPQVVAELYEQYSR